MLNFFIHVDYIFFIVYKMKPYNIKVTLAFPPDTDTPGFAEEQKIKVSHLKMSMY